MAGELFIVFIAKQIRFFFALGPIEQPCLRISKQILENNEITRHQVCTFCIAHKKTPSVSFFFALLIFFNCDFV